MEIVRARWSSSSFLLYAGAFVVLGAAIALLGWLASDYGEGAFFGWSALVFGVALALAVLAQRGGDRVVAGLFAFVAAVLFAVVAGSFFDLIGLGLGDGPLAGFDIGRLLLYLATMIVAFVLVGRFHFPLVVLVGAFAAWLFVVDLISGGGNWSAVVAIVVGLVYLLIGSAVDPPYGFWLHALAGLSIGGGVLYLWHDADWEWILVAIVALAYVAVAGGLERSSYAVYGAAGLFLAWSHFVERWVDDASSGWSPYSQLLPQDGGGYPVGGGPQIWQRALLYGLYGFVLVLLGLWLQRRRAGTSADQPTA